MPHAPSNNLQQTFRHGVEDFDDAFDVGDYRNFQQYLSPDDLILIQRVDDPGEFVTDYAPNILIYLNTEQVTRFPQFRYNLPLDHIEQHLSKKNRLVGHVTGDGYYWDTHIDYVNGIAPIPVRYSLRFKNTDPNGGGIWLLVTANVAPI